MLLINELKAVAKSLDGREILRRRRNPVVLRPTKNAAFLVGIVDCLQSISRKASH